MQTKNLEKTIGQIFDGSNKYVVPLYQRNFAWRQEQIEQLLQDIFEAFIMFKNSNGGGHYFVGSLVVLKRNNGDYEVIDGQQRLTTLSLITKIMGISKEPRLFYDSRPEVEEFFRLFYKSEDNEVNLDYPQVFHLKNAIDYINKAKLNPNDSNLTLENIENNIKHEFIQYLSDNVFLVRVEIPEDTDVAAYFEIMNNRGEQLQKQEILKSLLMEKLDGNLAAQSEFAKIWDACSQMDVPIQKSFDVEDRKHYFGEGYDSFTFNGLISNSMVSEETGRSNSNGKTIAEIIMEHQLYEKGQAITFSDDYDEDESKYKSIIDFPNFLMHVLKVQFPDKDIKLNEKFLLSTYREFEKEITPRDFIKELFYLRTVFDVYIIKTTADKNDSEDGERWTLRKPRKYTQTWSYVDTFRNENEEEKSSKKQERIVKALSMLQVSFRNRTYKNWLYEILQWFVEGRKVNVSYEDYIKKIDEVICSKFSEIKYDWKIIESFKEDKFDKGTDTPHFLFNFIDYLYWIKGSQGDFIIKQFDFKYWNSVEHHMARVWAERNDICNKETFIDCLGNLCLISRSSNSRLSDRDVKEKVETFGKGNLGPNRQVIYSMTEKNGMLWDEEQIMKHYNDLIDLLNDRSNLLAKQDCF